MKQLIVLILLVAGLVAAPAAMLLKEPFDYANGSLVTNSGGFWNTHSGTAGQLDVTNGAAFLTFTESEDVNAPLAGQPFGISSPTNEFFARFQVRLSSLPNSTGGFFTHFNAASNFRGCVWVLAGGAPGGMFRFGLAAASGSAATVTNTTDRSLNTACTLLLRITNGGPAQLWVDPVDESSPSITTPESAAAVNLSGYSLRQAAGIGALTVDDLVVATTFVEALTGIPNPEPPIIVVPPVSQVVTQGSNVTFSVVAAGTSPLAYQWNFAETNLPGATNASLTLTNVTPVQAGEYFVTITNIHGGTNSGPVELIVFVPPPPPPPGPPLTPVFSVLNYNAHGNFVADWTTNNFQVRALGRVVRHLNPDIVTFQEIPMTNNGWAQMPNFVATYLPGYFLATNSGTDGYIRSAIASRHPIARSQSWLARTNLSAFGLNTNFTRDLFEAEIVVPDFDEPLHVFTAHLKSGTSSSADAARRAAEARAISNFFVTAFLPAYGHRPYLLTGDLNEDIDRPATGSQQPIQQLANAATGLRLTTPTNPVTGSELTFSIQSVNGLTRRYDYILPGGLLYSNLASNLVFRSDLLAPVPPGLFSNDCRTASDHLPVMLWFGNPYPRPFRLLSVAATNAQLTLRWETMSNRIYGVEVSTHLTHWLMLATNLRATGTNLIFTTNQPGNAAQFFRVYREP